ncbi:DEAD/DEAH box helicase [Microbacterium candidum]|uniref:DEAD/DEAH box helicase n=1 Tax=Microbacterium candidum TaxID=3041922 RepID=A0ABT7MZ91_9MICO|nr:DEAD/DEAH box helicase [Microbacterium sp. ASV49]MDL9979773.1 DEAD/DEAH box helicase [Microbacterium sp. ASV49]
MPAPYFDPELIRRRTQGGSFERGVGYFHSGAVRALTWNEASRTLSADVSGSRGAAYRTTVTLDAGSARILSARCTCPVEEDCKHAVAAMLASNALVAPGEPDPAVPERTPSRTLAEPIRTTQMSSAAPRRVRGWRDLIAEADAPARARVLLALGFEVRERLPQRSAWSSPRTQEARLSGPVRPDRELLLGIRPYVRSASTGNWIKGDVSWESLRRPGGPHDEAQARWFAELHALTRDIRALGTPLDSSEWITLDTVGSELLWAHLAAAEGLGVPFIGTKKNRSVVLAGGADVALEITRDREALRLTAVATIDGETVDAGSIRPIGRTGAYALAYDGGEVTITLAPARLSAPVAALLGRPGGVDVPPDETAEFLSEHYPRIALTTTVRAGAGVELPARPEPALVLTIVHGAGHVLTYRFSWDYPGSARVPFDSRESDRIRDPDFESEAASRLRAAWAEATERPLVSSGVLNDVAAAEFAAELVPALEGVPGLRVEVAGTPHAYRLLEEDPRITVTTVESTDPDWFDLGVLLTIDGRVIPFTPLFRALSKGKKKLLLQDGAYFSLSHPALQRLKDLLEEAGELAEWDAGTTRISRHQTDLWADFEDLADEAQPAVAWRALAEGLRAETRVERTPAPAGLVASLRPYQQDGLDWLAFLWRHRLGGILADDMGLGKTLQMLAFVQHMREQGETRPVLVVAPASVLSTWRAEAARFTPDLRVEVVDATTGKRRSSVGDAASAADILVTSYTILRLDADAFAGVEWAAVVLDEAQFVKNPQTKLHRAAGRLRADAHYAVTGTPLENSLSELWALLSLTAPGLFASGRRFREEYIGPIEKGKVPENQEGGPFRAGRLARLRRRIRPLVLRRTKELVAADLPPKQEQLLRIELEPAHRAIYDATLQRERQKVLGLLEDLDRNRFIVFRSLTLLRMLSLAPGLVDPDHAHIPSSKLEALMEQLEQIVAEGHRVLVFSQFTSYLDLVRARLERDGVGYAMLDGSTRHRARVIEGFRSGEEPVFLISLKAGGFGLTLTEADYVFLLDPWWNPAVEAQAVDRTHRIGQTRPVNVYRMIAEGTIEDKVMALQQRKARLFQAVMDDDALFGQALTADDIRGLFDA